jgi:hypothetical protein
LHQVGLVLDNLHILRRQVLEPQRGAEERRVERSLEPRLVQIFVGGEVKSGFRVAARPVPQVLVVRADIDFLAEQRLDLHSESDGLLVIEFPAQLEAVAALPHEVLNAVARQVRYLGIGRVDLGHYGGQLDGFGDGTELVLAVNDGAVGHRVFRRHLKVNADRADYGHEDDQRDEKFPDHKCLATKMPRAEARGIVAFLNEKKQVSSGFEA